MPTKLPAEDAATATATDTWVALRRHTPARIALGRAGVSLPTRALLDFEWAHARARDAVAATLDGQALSQALLGQGWRVLDAHSRAGNAAAYRARPDWGRRLAAESAAALQAATQAHGCDLVIVIGDGLSASAVQQHAPPLLETLRVLGTRWRIAPIVIATHARVALADDIGHCLRARLAIHLIGERPGLSAPQSLGAYITFAPRVGRTDAERNCISNIRPEGLSFETAAAQIMEVVSAALQAGRTGTTLTLEPARTLVGPNHGF
jgi:ethanolamine ammonia-lyase small subunit